jgi:glutamyl-tRNA reductase
MDELRSRELEQALKRLRHLPEAERAVVEELSRSLMNKFLHSPSVRLREAAANGRGLGVVDTVRYLFGLGSPNEGAASEDQTRVKSRKDS